MMPYGKKRAHTSTGGQAPRKQLATKAARKNATYIPYDEEDSADEASNAAANEEGPQQQKQWFFTNLLDSLWTQSAAAEGEEESAQRTFAACEVIKPSRRGFPLTPFHVEGVGEFKLPLSATDTPKLRNACERAPFGQGLRTVLDLVVRRCWQLEALKVSFPEAPEFLSETIQSLALEAFGLLGVDAVAGVNLQAHLYKLLLYEQGGLFTFHRDTEKEKGMFATLILQLPTEEGFKGGQWVVKHKNCKEKKFDGWMVSSLGYCYMVFFADCLHELKKITFGTRLCLVFNLVRGAFQEHEEEIVSSQVRNVEEALQPWLDAVMEGKSDVFGNKMAIPLQHKYTEKNLCFSGLKGSDNNAANLLKNCRDMHGNKWLDLHLCLVTKHQCGDSSPQYSYDSGCDDADQHSMWGVIEEEISVKNWVGLDDTPSLFFQKLDLDMTRDFVMTSEGEDAFGDEPDEKEYEGHMGNSDPTLEYWYHKAMLVLWPKEYSISVACEAGVSEALGLLESTVDVKDVKFRVFLLQIFRYCEDNASQAWQVEAGKVGLGKDFLSPRLLNFCTRAGGSEDLVLHILRLLAKSFPYKPLINSWDKENVKDIKVGVRNIEVVKEIAAAIEEFGWEKCSPVVTNLVERFALTQSQSFVQLTNQLTDLGHNHVGDYLIRRLLEVFDARIGELEAHRKPVFTWRQPHAKIPGHPDVEEFLKGPEEKRTFQKKLPIALSLKKTYFENWKYTKNGISATGVTVLAKGQPTLLSVRKTTEALNSAGKQWYMNQEELKNLKQLRSTLVGLKRLDTEVNEVNKVRRNTTSRDFIDLTSEDD